MTLQLEKLYMPTGPYLALGNEGNWGVRLVVATTIYAFRTEDARDEFATAILRDGVPGGWTWGENLRPVFARMSVTAETRADYICKADTPHKDDWTVEPFVSATAERYVPATGMLADTTNNNVRYLILDTQDPDWVRAFQDPAHRDGALEVLRAGRWDGRGRFEGESGAYMEMYENIVRESEGPVEGSLGTWQDTTTDNPEDYKPKYEALVAALRQEAVDRGWCNEFEQFAAKAGIPAELTQSTVKVTLEFKVPRNHGIRTEAQAYRHFTERPEAEQRAAVTSFEVID